MKNNFRLFALLFILIISAITLCGCAQANFVTYNNIDGSIDEYILLHIDQQALLDHGYTPEQVMLDIKTNSYAEATSLLNNYQNKLLIELNLGNISSNEYTELFGGVKILEQEWKNGEYVIGFNYSNSTVYKKYYELVNNVSFNTNSPEQVKKLFYTKTYYRGTTNFGDYSIFYRIYNYYTNSQFVNISPQESTLTYSYTVNSRRMHSDANHITLDSNGNYIHTWNVSPDNPSKVITFYTITANRGVWVVTCLGIALSVCITLCTIAIIKRRKNVNRNIKQLNQNTDTNIDSDIDNKDNNHNN